MNPILLAVFFVLTPAFVVFLCRKSPALDKLGPALLCYGLGMLIANVGVLPEGASQVQTGLMNASIPIALPLLLFSIDIKRWAGLAGKAFLSFAVAVFAVLVASTVAFVLFRGTQEEAWKVSGMLIGVYTGGSINLNAIGLALKAKEHVLVLTNTADMLMCTPYFLFMLSYAQRLFGKVLPPFRRVSGSSPGSGPGDPGSEDAEAEDFEDSSGAWKPAELVPLAGAVLIACGIVAVSFGVYRMVPADFNMAALMLTITTLGVAASFVRRVREIKLSYPFGEYLIMIFCLVVGSLADLKSLLSAASTILVYTGIVVYGSVLVHLLLAAVFRIDADTMIVTSVAGTFSPPFVPVVAAALKNKEVIMSGMATGITGWIIGNYLGISFAYLLKSISF